MSFKDLIEGEFYECDGDIIQYIGRSANYRYAEFRPIIILPRSVWSYSCYHHKNIDIIVDGIIMSNLLKKLEDYKS